MILTFPLWHNNFSLTFKHQNILIYKYNLDLNITLTFSCTRFENCYQNANERNCVHICIIFECICIFGCFIFICNILFFNLNYLIESCFSLSNNNVLLPLWHISHDSANYMIYSYSRKKIFYNTFLKYFSVHITVFNKW